MLIWHLAWIRLKKKERPGRQFFFLFLKTVLKIRLKRPFRQPAANVVAEFQQKGANSHSFIFTRRVAGGRKILLWCWKIPDPAGLKMDIKRFRKYSRSGQYPWAAETFRHTGGNGCRAKDCQKVKHKHEWVSTNKGRCFSDKPCGSAPERFTHSKTLRAQTRRKRLLRSKLNS